MNVKVDKYGYHDAHITKEEKGRYPTKITVIRAFKPLKGLGLPLSAMAAIGTQIIATRQ